VSKTEEDLESTTADDAVDALTFDDTGDTDGPSTAELDALDESLVESIEEYTTGDTRVDSDDLVADEPVTLPAPTAESDADDVSAALFVGDEYDEDFHDDDQTFDVPKIVAATDDEAVARDETHDEAADDIESKDGETIEAPAAPGVSTDILEELRRADIDGPVVDHAPQDDTTSSRRRPKRPVDYDPAPVPVPLRVPRILGRKPRVRKVTRVVRHVDPWSVFKIALLANVVLYVIVLTAGVLLWNVAYATGTVENVERFFESFGWQSFEFNGGELYHSAWIAGLFAVLGLTGLWVLLATLFNLITDLVGGVRFTVLEEEVVESRTSPMRRFVVRRPEPEIPATLSDASGPLIREAVVDETGDIER
jgi:hypothetical protein